MFIPGVGAWDRDPNDPRQNPSASFPSESYVDFLHQADIQKKILVGCRSTVPSMSCAPDELFVKTGDVRFLPAIFMDTI